MIEKRLYLKALEIVEAYHKQVRLEAEEVKKTLYRPLEGVEIDDIVIPVFIHSASKRHLTKDKEYRVLNTKWNSSFKIECDSGKKKWYYNTNSHFRRK